MLAVIMLHYHKGLFRTSLFSHGDVTLELRLIHYENRYGQTYENRPCDIKIENDVNRDGRCDTAFLFCLVELPFQNPHRCTLGDYFTGFVGADDIHFISIGHNDTYIPPYMQRRSQTKSLWFLSPIYFRFKYPKNGIGLIVEVFDVDDLQNQTFHDTIDFYGRTLLDLRLFSSKHTSQSQYIILRSLYDSNTSLNLYCSVNYYGSDCNKHCVENNRYSCDVQSGKKLCNKGYFGKNCLNDLQLCENNPCLHNGTCVVYLRDYLCQCHQDFSGRSCETKDNKNKSYQCHCRPTHTGKHCEVEILPTCERIPCVNGQCLKVGLYNEICVCQLYWSGSDCTKPYIATTEKRLSIIMSAATTTSPSLERISSYSTRLTKTYIPGTFFPQSNSLRSTTLIKLNQSVEIKEYIDLSNKQYVNQLSAEIHFPETSTTIQHQYITKTFNLYKYTPCSNAPCL
ncbi:unnamed protein product, partial [Didymodactylos carnosus]